MNLLMFNLAVDDDHVTLAFSIHWIKTLAGYFDHVDVITMTAGNYQLPSNVTVWSVGRERSYPEWLRALRFYWLVGRVLRRRRINVVFTHMISVFAILFWPVALLTGLKNVLWYAHGATPKTLKLAHQVVDQVVSSTPQGFRLPSSKTTFIGQGIDVNCYRYVRRNVGFKFRIVTVGRLAPSKGLDIIINALASWQTSASWHLTVIGDATNTAESHYALSLRKLASDILNPTQIKFTGRLSSDAISSYLNQSDVFVNLSLTGSLDKAMVESMSSGCPVVSSNDAFREIAICEGFSECTIEHSIQGLLSALDHLHFMSLAERNLLGWRQSEVARRDHTLDGLIVRLHRVLLANALP
jgi:glycosyltransferase involved in cell wall biosynthesis